MTRVAVVTGARGAIGSAIVAALVQEDWLVLACGRERKPLHRLADRLERHPGEVLPWVVDLTTTSSRTLSDELRAFFPLTCAAPTLLVCAHGAPPCTTPTLELSSEDVGIVYRTDVLGTLLMAQVVGAQMVTQRQGAMVFVSSAHAHQTYPARAVYSMAKTAVVGLARALAVEWGPYNVRVNSVSPWQVAGETRSTAVAAQEAVQTGEDTETLYRRRAPLGRLVTREDVAQMVLVVAENRSMTGQDIRLDCGVSASMWHRPFETEEQ